jgi:WD40 repeat protein
MATTIAFTEGHAAGLAGVAYAGDQVLTCGADCDVRVHGEAAASWDLDESVNCIAVSPDGARFAAGLSDGQVLVRGFPGGEFLGNVTKNTLRVLDLSFSPSGSQMYVVEQLSLERPLKKASDRSARALSSWPLQRSPLCGRLRTFWHGTAAMGGPSRTQSPATHVRTHISLRLHESADSAASVALL